MDKLEQMKAEYIRGGTTYRELSEKYDVSQSTLRKAAADGKWTKLKNKVGTKAEQKMVEAVAQKKADSVELIDQAADKLLAITIEMMGREDVMCIPSNIRQMSMVLKDIREIKGHKSELDRQEQMARIEKLKKEVQEEQTDKEIKVVFMPEISEYSK